MNTPYDDTTEIAAEALTRRVVLRRIGGLSAAVTVGAASSAPARAEDRAMPAHQATPPAGGTATPEAEFTYGSRAISYVQDGDSVTIYIDGVPVDMATRLAPGYAVAPERALGTPEAGTAVASLATPAGLIVGQYHSDYFPFRGYDTVDDLARALVDTEGEGWSIDQ